MNDRRPPAIQVIASNFIKRILGPRFKSQLTSKNDSARSAYPYSQHRRHKAIGAMSTAGINHGDEGSTHNAYKPSVSQPFFNLDGIAVEPFNSDKYGQDASRPVSYRVSGISDGEASAPSASASPDGPAQRSLTMPISAPEGALVRSHTSDAPSPKILGHAKNSDYVNLSGGGGNKAGGQDDNATSYTSDMPGVDALGAPSTELGVDEEDDVPLIVFKEQAHRHSHAYQRRGSPINKTMAAERISPEIVITGSDGVHESGENEADMTLAGSDQGALQHSKREAPQSLAASDIGAASSSTSLQTFSTGSASPGPSFGYAPSSSTLSSPFPSSRPSPKIIVPSTPARRSSRRISMDRNGNLSSLRFSPTIVTRHPPMPLKLPTLPTLTPTLANDPHTDEKEKQKLDRRARYRSMPALPRGGSGRGAGGHEEEEDGDEDDDDTIDEEGEDDILLGEEEGRALSRIDESSSSGSSVRDSSSYVTAPSEAKAQPRQDRGHLEAVLPQVDTSKLDLSFLDKPSPTPLLETKRKGKARETEAAAPTEGLQREYFSSVLGGAAGASSCTLAANKRSSIYQTKPLSSIQGRSSITPLHTPKPGFAALKTLPLPLPPLADAERPGMYKHASQSMINVSLKKNEEMPLLLVNDGESDMKIGVMEPAEGKGKEKNQSKVSLAEEPPLPKILRRRSSMPSYSGLSSPPPPYPTFAPFPRAPVIQPREDEGMEKLPPYVNSIHLKAILPRKMEFSKPGVQAKDRKWRRVICVLEGTMFRVYQCPPRVAGVSAIEGWWERRVGVGDVSSSASTQTSATTLIHGPSIRSAQGSDPLRQNQNKEEQRNQSSATVTITPKMEPKRSRLAVPFLKSVKTHIRSRSDGALGAMSTATPRGSLSLRAQSPGSSDAVSSQSSVRSSGNGTQGAVSRSTTREEVPDPDPADLIKTYSLQRAECGLGLDYVKRKNVIRVKMDGEQFLVQAKEAMEVVAWIEGIQTGTNVALDLDERAMPRGPLFPRRRRRRRVVV